MLGWMYATKKTTIFDYLNWYSYSLNTSGNVDYYRFFGLDSKTMTTANHLTSTECKKGKLRWLDKQIKTTKWRTIDRQISRSRQLFYLSPSSCMYGNNELQNKSLVYAIFVNRKPSINFTYPCLRSIIKSMSCGRVCLCLRVTKGYKHLKNKWLVFGFLCSLFFNRQTICGVHQSHYTYINFRKRCQRIKHAQFNHILLLFAAIAPVFA